MIKRETYVPPLIPFGGALLSLLVGDVAKQVPSGNMSVSATPSPNTDSRYPIVPKTKPFHVIVFTSRRRIPLFRGTLALMQPDVETRYHEALTALGARKRWYQTATDDYFAAVVAAVDVVDVTEILERDHLIHEALPARNDLHLARRTLAALTAAQNQRVEDFVLASETIAETLADATRSRRFRRVAAAVSVSGGQIEFDVVGNRAVTLYQAWHDRHRSLTSGRDIVLATITDTAGVDPQTALSRADQAFERLAEGGYERAWDLARILSLDAPEASVARFFAVAEVVRGRRSKPLSDRRSAVAIAALAQHPADDLAALMARRLRSVHVSRWRPDSKTALTIAALLTMGASVSDAHPLHRAFHGFVLHEHYLASEREANAG